MPEKNIVLAVFVLCICLGARPVRAGEAVGNGPSAPAAEAVRADDLASLPLDRLLDLPVSGASRFPTSVRDTAAAVTVIGREEIRALGCRSLADVLATVPGVMVATDRSYSYLGVRGFYAPGDYNTRVLLLIDGNRVNDALYDQAFVGSEFPLDLELVERVEFIPGEASAVWGANAVFGVINVVTRPIQAGAGFQAQALAGSAGERRLRLEDTLEAGPGRVRWSASAYRLRGWTVQAPAGVTPHGDFEQRTDLALQARLGEFSLTALDALRTKGYPTLLDTVPGSALTRNIDNQQLAELAWAHTLLPGDEVTLRGFAGNYRFIGRYLDVGTPPVLNQDSDAARWWGAEARFTTSRLEGQKLTVGAEIQRMPGLRQVNADIAPPSAPYLDTRNPGGRAAVFAEDQARLGDHLTLDASARLDRMRRYGNEGSGRLALIWKRDEALTVKAIAGTSYRPPNAYEAYYQVGGPGGYLLNPALRPESARGAELHLDFQLAPADLVAASIYRNVARELIAQAFVPAQDSYQFVNQGRVTATGLELQWQHAWAGGARLRANASAMQAADHATSVPVAAFTPHYLANLAATVPLARDVQAGWLWRAVARRGGAGAYAVTGLALSSPERPHGESWRVSVANLFDRRYGDPGADLAAQPAVPQVGRSVQAELAWAF